MKSPARIAILLGLGGALLFLWSQILGFAERSHGFQAAISKTLEQTEVAQNERDLLLKDQKFYEDPLNLEKELRSRFHYRSSDETMVILVPKKPE